MQQHIYYPCIGRQEAGIYYGQFVDIPAAFTDADSLADLYINARDVLSGVLFTMAKQGQNLPVPSSGQIDLQDGEFLFFVDCWTLPILDKAQNSAVKKTLTIPKWLNDLAEQQGVNYSGLLQTALKQELGVSEPGTNYIKD